ncbi:ribonuclease Z [Deferribacter autotrophicus]|uniref:Ribonuclease Z n=1 Tax=Deferribacter autotrophicus TaxID=500465 RepID=A0A5A8F6K5_9BACT|nr:ribonuclease Z [Deferribacter autotrophicus]KAA0257344.1 ribonuclease Z [Deferribacter autotrophicus]
MVKFTILGSGSAVQYENRSSASYLLEYNDKKIILDAGFCLLDRLEKVSVLADEIDYIFVSHKHPDHFMGIIHFLFARKSITSYSNNPVTIFGFKGLESYINGFRKILGHWIEPEIDIKIVEDTKFSFDDFEYELFKTVHTDESVGIKLYIDGKKIVYTGDSEYFDDLIVHVNEADLFVADCGKIKGDVIEGHMSYDEVLQVAINAGVKNLLFSHFYPDSDKFEINVDNYNFKVFKARDLMSIYL